MRLFTRILSVILLLSLCLNANVQATYVTFSDMEGHWANDYVGNLANLKVINGYEDGTFKPEGTVTFAEFVKMTVVAMDVELRAYDVATDKWWYQPYFEKAVELLLIPDEFIGLEDYNFNISRQAMSTISVRAVTSLEDGIVMSVSQEEVMQSIVDQTEISAGYQQEVSLAYGCGLLTGYPDKSFKPKGFLSRAEAAVVISRIKYPEYRKPLVFEKPTTSDNYPVANNDLGSVQRIDYNTIEIAVHDSSGGYKDSSKALEVNAPVIGGIERVELLDTLIKYQNWIYTKYFNEDYNLYEEKVTEMNKSQYQYDNTVYEMYKDGFMGDAYLASRYPVSDRDFFAKFQGVSSINNYWNAANFSPENFPMMLEVSLSTEQIELMDFYKSYDGHETTKSTGKSTYELGIWSGSGMNQNMIDDYHAFIDILFKEDSAQVKNIMAEYFLTEPMKRRSFDWSKSGFSSFSGSTSGYFKGFYIGDRYLSVLVYADAVRMEISYLQ